MYHYQTTQLVGPEEIIVLEHKSSKEKTKSIIDIILHSKIPYIILCITHYQNRIQLPTLT